MDYFSIIIWYTFRLLYTYIDAPRKKDGEINYNEFARKISNAFDFEGNNIGTLAKALNIENNNMNNDSKDLFKIPHIKSIS